MDVAVVTLEVIPLEQAKAITYYWIIRGMHITL